MKSRLLISFTFLVGLIIVYVPESQAGEVPEWTIKDGEEYNKVELYDLESIWEGVAYDSLFPPTIVDMNGGHVGDWDDSDSGMFTYESTTFNMSGGVVEYLHTYNSSTANISGGVVGHDLPWRWTINAYDSSTVNVYDGALLCGTISHDFSMSDSSTLNVYGGDVQLLVCAYNSSLVNIYDGDVFSVWPYHYSTVNVCGGDIDTYGPFQAPETATVNIFGYDFEYDPEDSLLTGVGPYGTAITYWELADPAAHPNINLIHDFVPSRGVDFCDFAVLARAWGSSPGDDNWNQICDISDPNDDIINESDLDVFIEYWLSGVE